MKYTFNEKLLGLGSRAGAVALAACISVMGVPAMALAIYVPGNTTGRAVMTATGDSWGGQLKKGAVKTNADGTKTASYTGIAHSDLAHYSAYGLTTQITFEKDGTVTGINLTSGNETFAGAWGYKNAAKQMAAIDGYLPDGCSFEVTGSRADGFAPVIKGADSLGVTFAGLAYYSVDASGKATPVEAKTSASTSSPAASAKARPGASASSTYDDWDYKAGTVKPSDASVNVVCVTYSIGAETALKFNTYFAIDEAGNVDANTSSAANKHLDTIAKTTWDVTPDLTGTMAETNRDKWAVVMATVSMQRELQSWSKSLTSGFEASGEIDDLDTISGATKTSEPFVAALNQAYKDGYIKSIAENVKLTIDAGSKNAIDVNANPADRSTVTKNAQGCYVLTNSFPYGEDRSQNHGTTLDSIATYAIDGKVSTAEVAKIAKGRSDYQPLNSYSPKSIIGYEEDDGDPIYSEGWPDFTDITGDITVDYDTNDGVAPIGITVNNPKITHLALTYTIGHGTITVVYDLAQMEAAGQVKAQIAKMKASNSAQVKAARKAYNALSTDVRGFVTNIDKLVRAEAKKQTIKVTPATKTVKAAAVKKKAQSYKLKVTGVKTAVTYKSSSKNVTVSAQGKVTVAKGAKKGTYKITVKAAASTKYAAAAKTVKVQVA